MGYLVTNKKSPFYIYRHKVKDSNGKWRSIDVSTKVPVYKGRLKKEEDAEKKKAEKIGEEKIQKMLSIEERKSENHFDRSLMTFKEYAEYFLSICHLDVGTIYSYRNTLEKHIFPEIGNIPIGELTQQDLNAYIQRKYDECIAKQDILDKKIAEAKKNGLEVKISSSERPCTHSLKKHRDIIRLILSNAVQDGDLEDNVAKKINSRLLKSLPPSEFEVIPYSKEEINKLMKAVLKTKMEAPIVLASALGLRREEILGLLWDDIKWDKNLIEIRNVVIKVNGISSSIFRKTTKTKKSKQFLPMSWALKEYLEILRKEQEQAREAYEDYDNHTIAFEDSLRQIKTLHYSEDKLDFICRDEFGEVLKPNYISQTFKKSLVDNELRLINFHGLRHSVGTIILEETHDLKMAQCQLRHETIETTADIYTPVLSQKYCEETANIMASSVGNIVDAKKNG